jgi:rod shape-determining protein MreC
LKGLVRNSRILLWVFFVAFALFLLSMSAGQRLSWNPLEQALIEVTAPVQRLFQGTVALTESIWSNYFSLVHVRQENLRLKRLIDSLKMENSRYREALHSHERLKALFQFKQSIDRPVVAAQVIGLDPTGWFRSVIIDKGERSGIAMDMPVVNASGVVGRVVSVSPNYAKVLLVIDQNSSVDCLVERSRDRGMVRGLSETICSVDYMVKTSDVKVNDRIVTSGLGGVFPKGISIGHVVSADESPGDLFRRVRLRPSVDFSRLEEVLVILKEKISTDQLKQEK